MTTRPADPSPAPRDDAPAVVWLRGDEDRCPELVEPGELDPIATGVRVPYHRVPDAATLDALERLAGQLQPGGGVVFSATPEDVGAHGVLTRLLTDLRAARDAAGRNANG
jgi:hypothetical protein